MIKGLLPVEGVAAAAGEAKPTATAATAPTSAKPAELKREAPKKEEKKR